MAIVFEDWATMYTNLISAHCGGLGGQVFAEYKEKEKEKEAV